MKRKSLLTAWNESGNSLFIKLCFTVEEACKYVLNHGLASSVSHIEFRRKKYTISDIYRMADRSLKRLKSA